MGRAFGVDGAIIQGGLQRILWSKFEAYRGGMHEIGPVARCLYKLHQMLACALRCLFHHFTCPITLIFDFGTAEAHPNIWNRDYYFARLYALHMRCKQQVSELILHPQYMDINMFFLHQQLENTTDEDIEDQ
jgi:hypothetical protein